jgi:hypothetical protein
MPAHPSSRQELLSLDFDQVSEPGVYVTQHGEMFRVHADFLAKAHRPAVNWEPTENRQVTRISEDPYLPITRCRQLAAHFDLTVNF